MSKKKSNFKQNIVPQNSTVMGELISSVTISGLRVEANGRNLKPGSEEELIFRLASRDTDTVEAALLLNIDRMSV